MTDKKEWEKFVDVYVGPLRFSRVSDEDARLVWLSHGETMVLSPRMAIKLRDAIYALFPEIDR